MGRMARVCTLIGIGAALALLLSAPRLAAQIDDEWIHGPHPGLPAPPWLAYRVAPPVAPPGGPPGAIAGAPGRGERIQPRFEQLDSEGVTRFRLPLLDGSDIVVLHTETQRRPGGFVWIGEIEGEPGSHVILSVAGKSLSGSIYSPFRPTILLDGTAAGGYRIRRVDPSEFKPEGPPITTMGLPPGPGPKACMDCDDALPNVDLMVVYTPGARDGWDLNADEPLVLSDEAMEADVYQMVATTNRTFIDSEVDVRLNLVHIAEAPFDDQPHDPDLLPMLTKLRTNADILAWRDIYAADIVVLLIGEGPQNGLSPMPLGGASGSTCDVFANVVKRGSAVAQLSFPHEVGHLFGANHNCADSTMPAAQLPGTNHGFDMLTPTPCTDPVTGGSLGPWCTLMSTRNSDPDSTVRVSNMMRRPYWSNPNLLFPPGMDCAVPMGTLEGDCQAYDADVLNTSLQHVVNYRCSSPTRDDVWMKDTWDDTGAEPNDDPAGQDMWKSPDIWVRNQQDTALEFAHLHENPQRGGDNWIYAKLRNGSNDVHTGRLEFRYADAATSTAWESGWTVIETPVPATIPAHGSTIVELRWPSVPDGSTHFCLLARWLSDDPADDMTFTEVENIAVNVRNNNNIVWKNLTIVNLIAVPDEARVMYSVRHIPDDDSDKHKLRSVKLRIGPPRGVKAKSFIGEGRVLVRFDTALLHAWELAGSSGAGYQLTPDGFLLSNPGGAVFNLIMPGTAEGRVEMVLGKKPGMPRRDYLLDCSLWDGNVGLGGVSFEIRNARRAR